MTSELSTNSKVVLWVTYINIVLYALCYQLQRPVEPFLVEQLSGTDSGDDSSNTASTYGQLQSFFSAIQTIGSPLVGILLDRVGIRNASCLVFGSSALSYAILACASDWKFLFYAKIPTALQHAFLVAQATAAASTSDAAERAQALARMTTAYAVGATLGPALGGVLSQRGDLFVGARLAVVGSLISVVLSWYCLPGLLAPLDNPYASVNTSSSPRKAPTGSSSTPSPRKKSTGSTNPVAPTTASWTQQLKNSLKIGIRCWPLLLVKVLSGVATSMHSTALPLVLKQDLHFDPASLGFTMSATMMAVALFGVFGMAPLARICKASGMSQGGLLVRAALVIVLAALVSQGSTTGTGTEARSSIELWGWQLPLGWFTDSSAPASAVSLQLQVVLVSVLYGLAQHALATGLTTQTTSLVQAHQQGSLLGLEHGLFSMARIYGPPLGTSLLSSKGGFWNVAQACAGIDVLLVGILVTTSSLVVPPVKQS